MNAGRSRTSRRIRRRSIPIGSARPPSSSRSSVEAAKESIHFVRAFVQDELSKAINRLKREIADLATAKPQPAGSVLDITKETLTSFERRLSQHAEHLSRLEDRMKRLETKRAR